MKTGKVLHIILVSLVILFLSGHLLLNNKKIQQSAILHIAQATLGTDVSAGRVQLVYPFGIIIDNLTVYDLKHDTLAHAASVSLRIKPSQLLKKEISITSVRVNSPKVILSKDSVDAEPNYGFISSMFGGGNGSMALRANSVLIRNGSVRYDLKTAQFTDSLFNPDHIGISGLMANLSIKAVSSDSVSVIVRKFGFSEQSGFRLVRTIGSVNISHDMTDLSGLVFTTPQSEFHATRLIAGIGLKSQKSSIPQSDIDISTTLTGSDFKAFLPQLAGMTDPIDLKIKGTSHDDNINVNAISLHAPHNIDLGLSGILMFDSQKHLTGCRDAEMHGSFTASFPSWIQKQLSYFGFAVPDQLTYLGEGSLKAELNSYNNTIDSEIEIVSQSGRITATLSGQDNQFKADLNASDVNLLTITGNNDLGNCSLTAQTQFRKEDKGYYGTFGSNIVSLMYKRYNYRDIAISGAFEPDYIMTDLDFADLNGALTINSGIGIGNIPFLSLKMDADSLNLAAYNLAGKDSLSLTTTLTADLVGADIDHLSGKISIDSLYYADKQDDWFMNNLIVSIGEFNELIKVITVYSDFMSMSVVGDYKLSGLPASLAKASSDVLPTLGKMLADKFGAKDYLKSTNSFAVEANIDNLDFLQSVFHLPISIEKPSHLQMTFVDEDSTCIGKLTVPYLSVSGQVLKNGLITLNSYDGTCDIKISGLYDSGDENETTIDISLMAFEDIIRGLYSWNNTTGDINGTAKTLSQFFRYDKLKGLKTLTLIDTTNVTVNGTIWNLAITRISTDMHKVNISGFSIRNKKQYLYADGTISSDTSDVFHLYMKNIDLGHTLSKFGKNKIGLEGIATGEFFIKGLLGNPAFYGLGTVDNFQFMDSYHGNLTADCRWNSVARRVELEATANDNYISTTRITGSYLPDSKFIDVDINANHTDLRFLNNWTKSVFKELGGRAVGNLRLFGELSELDLEGEAILENGFFVQDAINTTFQIKRDTLWFKPGKMIFRDVEFYDEQGHDGLLTCILSHDNFSNWRVDMSADVADMLVYYQPKNEKSNMFASVYAEGSMTLKYNPSNGLAISVNARTAPGTRMGYKPTSGSVADYNFLTIVDRNVIVLDEETVKLTIPDKTKSGKRFSLDFNIECSEDALVEMSLTSLNGFFRGSGDISLKYDPKNGTQINGIYNLTYGQCTLSLETLIRKNFTLMEGSYLRFNGDPLATELNLQTYHNVNSVSIYDLDPSATSSNNVRVRCLMNINGNVADPQIAFDIDMPYGTSEEKDILASAISTEEQRNLQFMYLLAIGRFYTYDTNAMNSGLTPSTMESLVNSTVSGQINNLLSQVLDNEKVSISSNLSASSYLSNDATNLNNKELEGILEAHLLDNRLLVNGSFGYRENTINNTANFIGDLEVKYKLFPRKGISIKGYNKANDKYFSKTTLTTQGVGLVFEKDF